MKKETNSLAARMKEYEGIPRTYLVRKTPVIIRIDGKAFHTFTRGFEKPFDIYIESAMQRTMIKLCKSIQGCVFGYTQSDEITLVLCDYQKPDTDAWFGYNVLKICSVAASMASVYFHDALIKLAARDSCPTENELFICEKLEDGGVFDARAWNLPKEEVVNCLIWRQQDAIRNSVQAVAQSQFSHKELQGLKTEELKAKLKNEKNIDWEAYPIYRQRGCCAVNTDAGWLTDREIPLFTENRDYVEKRIRFEE